MGPGGDQTRNPRSAVRYASVARHVTDCATQPGIWPISFCEVMVIQPRGYLVQVSTDPL